jgi:hypothetical protein
MEVSGQIHAPAALLKGKKADSRSVGAWVGPTAGLDVSEKREICFFSIGIRNPYRQVPSLVSIPTSTQIK